MGFSSAWAEFALAAVGGEDAAAAIDYCLAHAEEMDGLIAAAAGGGDSAHSPAPAVTPPAPAGAAQDADVVPPYQSAPAETLAVAVTADPEAAVAASTAADSTAVAVRSAASDSAPRAVISAATPVCVYVCVRVCYLTRQRVLQLHAGGV